MDQNISCQFFHLRTPHLQYAIARGANLQVWFGFMAIYPICQGIRRCWLIVLLRRMICLVYVLITLDMENRVVIFSRNDFALG